MPEGPEIERLAGRLQAWKGYAIGEIHQEGEIDIRRFFPKGTPQDESLSSYTITRIRPTGKYIWIETEAYGIAIHLNSTGWLVPAEGERDPLTANFIHSINDSNRRFRIHLSNGKVWYYHDPRTWGRWTLCKGTPPQMPEFLTNKGPDWLANPTEARKALLAAAQGSTRQAKDLLTDQKVTAGIGNYLTCEACWHAKIHPHRTGKELSNLELLNLMSGIERSIKLARENDDHRHWAVFKKAGKACPRDQNHTIAYHKDHNSKRGSYFCPVCQPPPNEPGGK